MTITQLSVYMENKPGKLSDVMTAISEAGVNIRALSLADTSDFGIVRLITSDAEKAMAALEGNMLVSTNKVLAVEMSDESGSLSKILKAFDGENVNVEYMYAFAGKAALSAYLVMQVSDIEKAEEILAKGGIGTLCDADLLGSLG